MNITSIASAIDAELRSALAARSREPARPGESPLQAERRRRAALHASRRTAHPLVHSAFAVEGSVSVRRHVPIGAPRGDMVWVHGGGWIYGDAEADDAMCARFAHEASVRVTAVDYRLAPEHPYPAGLDDVDRVFRAVRDSAAGPVIVAGASAGGTLATGLALRTAAGGAAQPDALLLICPALDDRATDDEVSAPLRRADMDALWRHYLEDAPGDAISAPARARDVELSALPPTYIATTSADPLRAEAWRWASRLADAGVAVTVEHFPGGYHGFEYEAPDTLFSHAAVSAWTEALQRLLRAAE